MTSLGGVGVEGMLALATAALGAIDDGVIITCTEGRVMFMNPVAEALVERTAGSARGAAILDVLASEPEDPRGGDESPVSLVLRPGAPSQLRASRVIVRRDGRRMPIDLTATQIKGNEGAVIGAAMVLRDATISRRDASRRRFILDSAEALASAVDYRAALRSVVDLAVPRVADICGIDVLDPASGRIERLAIAHVDPAKLPVAEELATRYPHTLDGPRGVGSVIKTGKPELFARIPSGALKELASDERHRELLEALAVFSCMVVPLRGRERVLGAITFVMADSRREYDDSDVAFAELVARRAGLIIEKRKLEDERECLLEREREARREAEVANRAKDELLATVSHELRNPLSAIIGWTDLLLRRSLPESLRAPLETIERNAQAEARLIEDVLDFSRVLTGKLRLQVTRADVGQAVSDALEAVRASASDKGLHFVTQLDKRLETRADQVRLQQVFANLLSNAVKFTPRGGGVLVSAVRRGDSIEVTVQDSGEGISAEALGYIFEPFRQADARVTRAHGGLGLGLAIVRRLVEAHAGSVRAESAGEGRGATFVVTLPVVAGGEAPSAAPPARSAPIERRLEGTRVLVVDDAPDGVALAKEILSLAGATVETATSAAQALDLLASGAAPIDVLVSDIAMPEVDGNELLARARALREGQGGALPAVALTAYAREEDAARTRAHGFELHVTKPVVAEVLIEAVAALGAARALPLER